MLNMKFSELLDIACDLVEHGRYEEATRITDECKKYAKDKPVVSFIDLSLTRATTRFKDYDLLRRMGIEE